MMCNVLDGFCGTPVAPTTRAKCLVGLGSTLAALHKYTFAVDDFDKAITIYLSLQQEQSNREQSGLMLVDCMIRRGNAYRGQLALSESVRDYNNAIELCGRISEGELQNTSVLLLARAYFNRSLKHAMQGEFALAFLDLERARTCAMRHTLIAMDRFKELSLQLLSPIKSLVRRDTPDK